MNKYLILSAAGLLASSAIAGAKTYCFHFQPNTSGGGSYCDGGMISTRVDRGALGGAVRAWVHLSNNCVGGTSEGYGVRSKVRGSGSLSLMSDDYLAKNYGNFHTAVSYALPKKIENGAPWAVWVGMDGTTFFEASTGGVLINVGTCQNRAAKHGGKSTLEFLKAINATDRRR
jgi:hypothetical protein